MPVFVAFVTVALVRLPSVVHAAIAAMATRASRSAYSTVVKPSSSIHSCLIILLSPDLIFSFSDVPGR